VQQSAAQHLPGRWRWRYSNCLLLLLLLALSTANARRQGVVVVVVAGRNAQYGNGTAGHVEHGGEYPSFFLLRGAAIAAALILLV